MAEAPLLYRPKPAADRIGVSRAMVYKLMANGELASVKIGAARLIEADELARYVERLRQESKQDSSVSSGK
jgi:excisionase family DNA binding protein